jgi:hypothetical protein
VDAAGLDHAGEELPAGHGVHAATVAARTARGHRHTTPRATKTRHERLLILSATEYQELVAHEPEAAPWLRRYVGAEELIHGSVRWCLWLSGISPNLLRKLPRVMARVEAVCAFRRSSPTLSVQAFAEQPTLFTQDRQPTTDYLAIPAHSSENRRFIPLAFLPPAVIASNALRICQGGTLFHFGVMSSTMHNAWVRYTCGRLESRYRYEPNVYNTFPWAESLTDAQRAAIESAAQAVLDTRTQFPGATLADLYDPLTMPPALLKAHQKLDAAVDAAYGRKGFKSDAERVAFLFEMYQRITSLLPAEPSKRRAASVVFES